MHATLGSFNHAPLNARGDQVGVNVTHSLTREVMTATASYRVRPMLHRSAAAERPFIFVIVERVGTPMPSIDELRVRFALTRAQAEVALLLARGMTNDEIARQNSTSAFTARRHTEKVFQKLGVRTRAAVMQRITSER